MAKIGIGVIGLGRMGRVYGTFVAAQMSDARLVAVSDSRPEAMQDFEARICSLTQAPVHEALFISWGDYDRNQFLRDCERNSYPYPFGEHLNLKQACINKYGLKRAGMQEAMKHLQLPIQGTHHRGKDDALNISTIFKHFEE